MTKVHELRGSRPKLFLLPGGHSQPAEPEDKFLGVIPSALFPPSPCNSSLPLARCNEFTRQKQGCPVLPVGSFCSFSHPTFLMFGFGPLSPRCQHTAIKLVVCRKQALTGSQANAMASGCLTCLILLGSLWNCFCPLRCRLLWGEGGGGSGDASLQA